jgi:hypothetical protein
MEHTSYSIREMLDSSRLEIFDESEKTWMRGKVNGIVTMLKRLCEEKDKEGDFGGGAKGGEIFIFNYDIIDGDG